MEKHRKLFPKEHQLKRKNNIQTKRHYCKDSVFLLLFILKTEYNRIRMEECYGKL